MRPRPRPRPESVRPRPKIFCEAEAKTYEAKAEATVSNESCNIQIHRLLLSYCISYIIQEIRSVERGYLSHCCSAWPNL